MASDTRGNSIDSRRPGRRPVAAGPARTTATVVAMLRPVSLLPALVAVVATLSTAAPAVADKPVEGDPNGAVDRHAAAERLVASRAQARTAPARPRAVQRDPLAVTISEITPSSIPARGPIEVTGIGHQPEPGPLHRHQPARLHGRRADDDQRRAGRGRPARPVRVRREPDHRPRHVRQRRRAGAGSVVVVHHPGPAVADHGHDRPASTGSAYTPSATPPRPATTPPTAGPARSSRSPPTPGGR